MTFQVSIFCMVRSRFFPAFLIVIPVLLWSAGIGGGRELFHKMQVAIGDADKIAAVKDYEQIERADTWFPDGKPRGVARKRVRFIRPNYLRIDQVGPGDTYVLYFDGKSGWEIMPDGKVANLAGGELRFAQGYLNGLQLNSWLSDRDPDVLFSSASPNVITVSIRGDATHKNEITLDASTFLPLKSTGISLADPDHPVSSETRIQQWREFDGLKFPIHTINLHDGKKLAEIFTEDIRLNRKLNVADLAKKPADLRPVIAH